MSAESEVRATLAGRLAGLLPRLRAEKRGESNPDTTFASLFNGARRGNYVPPCHPSFGKAEAEWGWPHDWEMLRDEGLIEFDLEEVDAPGAVGGRMVWVNWSVTDRGWEVRKDDLAYFRSLMDAMAADELTPSATQPDTPARQRS